MKSKFKLGEEICVCWYRINYGYMWFHGTISGANNMRGVYGVKWLFENNIREAYFGEGLIFANKFDAGDCCDSKNATEGGVQ